MENEHTRTLRMEIPLAIVNKAAPDPEWDLNNANGWEAIGLNLYWTGTIDLSGYVREMKTFYPSAGLIQQGAFTSERDGEGYIIYTIVSSIPLDPLTVMTSIASTGGPGFLTFAGAGATAGQNWETVIFAQSELYVPNQNIAPNTYGISQPLSSNQSGSLSATAADTLYCMKCVVPFGAAQLQMYIPASRILLPGKFGTEPDVEYMMRLKRSVELANQV